MRPQDVLKALAGRTTVQLAAAGLASLALVAGCGATPAPGAGSHLVGLTSAHHSGPQVSTKARSIKLARQVLARNVLPRGSRALPQRPVPAGLDYAGDSMVAKSSIHLYRLHALPMSMSKAAAFLHAHPPTGLKSLGIGRGTQGQRVIETDVSFAARRTPWGVAVLQLVDTIVPQSHGRSLLRTDVQVIWYPPRSAAEHLVATRYRAVRVSATIDRTTKARVIQRTFTSRAVIGQLTRLLNAMPASPDEAINCPLIVRTNLVTFEPRAGQQRATVKQYSCPGDVVMVGGKAQPSLQDFGKLAPLVNRLLGLPEVQPAPTAHP